jgi:hypothetical protein
MWEFLIGLSIGDAVRKSPLGRFVRPALALFLIGLLIACVIYTIAVFHAVSERSKTPHVPTHSAN